MDERKILYLKRRKKIVKYLSCKKNDCSYCRAMEDCTVIEKEWIDKYDMIGKKWEKKMNITQEELCLEIPLLQK